MNKKDDGISDLSVDEFLSLCDEKGIDYREAFVDACRIIAAKNEYIYKRNILEEDATDEQYEMVKAVKEFEMKHGVSIARI